MRKVLIADDHEQNLYLLQFLLDASGYEVIQATNGAEALEKARLNPPDIIISDILMPVMDGFVLCRKWMMDDNLKTIPFIFYTATYNDPKDQKFALSLGAERFLTKPVEPNVLLQTLEEIFDNYEERQFTPSDEGMVEEKVYFKEYNETLIRKLEDKMTQLEEANQRLIALQDAIAAITGSLGLEEVLKHIGRGAVNTLSSTAVWILVVDEEEQTLSSKIMLSAKDEEVKVLEEALGMSAHDVQIPIVPGRNFLTDAVISGETIFVPDLNKLESDDQSMSMHVLQEKLSGVRAFVVVPLEVKDQAVGVLAMARSAVGEIPAEEMQLISAFAHQAAIAIENAKLYEEQRQYANRLESEVAARTSDLTKALEKAQVADRLKSQFVSDVNHQLRTPLYNIKLYLTLLERGRPENHPRYIETLTRETGQLQRLIEAMLDLSKLDSDEAPSNLEPVDVNRLVGSLVTDRSSLAAEKRLTLDVEIDKTIPMVLADIQLLFQALTNLVANAINYTPVGGAITLCTGKAEMRGYTWVTVDVIDTGPGIPDADQEHIFERFYRGEAGRESGVAGTGLGLAICKEIMNRHAGHITVESAVGDGSKFTLWLQKTKM